MHKALPHFERTSKSSKGGAAAEGTGKSASQKEVLCSDYNKDECTRAKSHYGMYYERKVFLPTRLASLRHLSKDNVKKAYPATKCDKQA